VHFRGALGARDEAEYRDAGQPTIRLGDESRRLGRRLGGERASQRETRRRGVESVPERLGEQRPSRSLILTP